MAMENHHGGLFNKLLRDCNYVSSFDSHQHLAKLASYGLMLLFIGKKSKHSDNQWLTQEHMAIKRQAG